MPYQFGYTPAKQNGIIIEIQQEVKNFFKSFFKAVLIGTWCIKLLQSYYCEDIFIQIASY